MLTPEEIAFRQFSMTKRGYDREEVQAFLQEVSKGTADRDRQIEALGAELEGLRAELAAARQQPTPQAVPAEDPSPYATLGADTERVLQAARQAAEEMSRKARYETDRQIQSARRDAAKIISEGERRREQIEQVIASLEQERRRVAGALAAIADRVGTMVASAGPPVRVPRAPRVEHVDQAAQLPPGAVGAQPEGSDSSTVDRMVGDGAVAAADGAPPQAPDGQVPAPHNGFEQAPAPASVHEAAGEQEDGPVPEDEPSFDGGGEPEQPVDGEPEQPVDGEPEQPSESPQELSPKLEEETPDESTPQLEGQASAVSLRAGALEPLHPRMLRKLKRAMSELQNIALDRLRTTGGRSGAEDVALADAEMTVLADTAAEFLDQAYRSGLDAAAVLAGSALPVPEAQRDLTGDFAADSGGRIQESLSTSSRIGFASDEELAALNDRVGAVFSELKGTAADELSAVHLIRAYEYGLLDAWAAGPVQERTWVLGRELRCPEGRCRQNDETGAVDVQSAFPSGHEVPPVHVGCTCTTVPVVGSST